LISYRYIHSSEGPTITDAFSKTSLQRIPKLGVSKTLITPNGTHALLQLSPTASARSNSTCLLFSLPKAGSQGRHSRGTLAAPTPSTQLLPGAVAAQIKVALGFIQGSRNKSQYFPPAHTDNDKYTYSLVFIDHEFWVCSYNLQGGDLSDIVRHFFLPRDWILLDALELAHVTPDGRLLCPRDGEVAVISNGLRMQWDE